MAAKLDRSRAFATITGILDEELTGACYWQDGKHFTASGDELNPEPELDLAPESEQDPTADEIALTLESEPEPEVPAAAPVVKPSEKKAAKSKDTSDLDLL